MIVRANESLGVLPLIPIVFEIGKSAFDYVVARQEGANLEQASTSQMATVNAMRTIQAQSPAASTDQKKTLYIAAGAAALVALVAALT